MKNKEIRIYTNRFDYDLFFEQKKKHLFKNNTEYLRYLLQRDVEQSSLTSAESLLKKFQERFELDSYMTLRIVKTILMMLYRNNLYLQDGKPDEVKELFRVKSLENVASLYKTFEEEFKKAYPLAREFED